NKGIYIATLEPNSGKSLGSIGLMNTLLGKTQKVGYFRPIIDDVEEGMKDNHIDTIISYFKLPISYDEAYGYTRSENIQKRTEGQSGEIIDNIINKYKKLEDEYEIVLVERSDFSGDPNVFELD